MNSVHTSIPAIQPVLHPGKSVPVQDTNSLFLQKNTVGDGVKGFAEVWVDYVNSLSLTYQMSPLLMERGEAGQAGPASCEPMLTSPDLPDVPHVLCDLPQDDVLHNCTWH